MFRKLNKTCFLALRNKIIICGFLLLRNDKVYVLLNNILSGTLSKKIRTKVSLQNLPETDVVIIPSCDVVAMRMVDDK